MIKILYITPFLPYDFLSHAGGQTFNYYIKQLAKSENFKISVASIVAEGVKDDGEKYGIKVLRKNIKTQGWHKIYNLGFRYNPLHRYGNLKRNTEIDALYSYLTEIKVQGYQPDIVIMEWTQMLMGIDTYIKIFPSARFVASEHDVTYLRYFREIESGKRWNSKFLRRVSYSNMKIRELKCLEKCDLIKTHNEKDKQLLVDDGIVEHKISSLVAYYHSFDKWNYNPNSKNIVFYGAMSRPENYEAALWFVEEVLPLLADLKITFVIIGGNPPKELLDIKQPNVVVTGFVDDLKPLFENALCMVAPLRLGAGIKVKVLEAMSAGIPVLTNDIGIEGIPAKNNVDYLYCKKANDYNIQVRRLLSDPNLCLYISKNERTLLKNSFNIKNSVHQYIEELVSIVGK